ncbi:MAG: hypothetical protein ACRDMX_13740 [Solirubrobacteraceae bacterium]
MRLRSLVRRRPSPAIVLSSIALFMSLGGVGYAAINLPSNSVGTRQIRKEAVTYTKIRPSSVGRVRANTGQLQVRVSHSCNSGTAIGAIDRAGHVTCNPTLPAEFGTTNNTAGAVGSSPITVTDVALPTGASYIGFANPTATVTPASGVTTPQHVAVSCTLSVGSNTETRVITIDTTGVAGQASAASIPLQATGPSGTGSVACTASTAKIGGTGAQPADPNVSITSAINAIQTSSNS